MLCEISQKEKHKYYVISFICELIETEQIVACQDEKVGYMGEVGQRVQILGYELNMFWGFNVQYGD